MAVVAGRVAPEASVPDRGPGRARVDRGIKAGAAATVGVAAGIAAVAAAAGPRRPVPVPWTWTARA